MAIYMPGDGACRTSAGEALLRQRLAALEAVATNSRVCALAQVNEASHRSVRWLLDPARRFPPIRIESETGVRTGLVDFLAWAGTLCPSDRTILVVGGGRDMSRGAASSPSDGLPPSLATAVAASQTARACEVTTVAPRRRLDVVVLDAVAAGSLEAMCEFADSVSAFVAPSGEDPPAGIDLAAAAVRLTEWSGVASSSRAASAFTATSACRGDAAAYMAIDLTCAAFTNALEHLRVFSHSVLAWSGGDLARRATVVAAFGAANCRHQGVGTRSASDLGLLLESFGRVGAIPAHIRESLELAVGNLRSCVVDGSAGADGTPLLGISIFSPEVPRDYVFVRPDYVRLRLSALTGWSNLLDHLHGPPMSDVSTDPGLQDGVILRAPRPAAP